MIFAKTMSIVQYLLLFLSVYDGVGHCKVIYYNITASQNDPCPQVHNSTCHTLSQLLADFSTYHDSNETEVSLSFLPGNHTLNVELSFTNVDRLLMSKYPNLNGTLSIQCVSLSGKLIVNGSRYVSIKSMHFIGCGGNRIVQTEQIVIEDTIFETVDSRDTVLTLDEIAQAVIISCSFLFNTNRDRLKDHSISEFPNNQAVVDYVSHTISGGALYTAFSNVSIINSNFMHNRAEIGGAFVAHNSSVHIQGSMFNSNRATFGGAMVTSESTVDVDNSTFSANTADIHGGMMLAYKDLGITMTSTVFVNNSGMYKAGVIKYLNASSITVIESCVFTENTASHEGGGVIATSGESTLIIRKSNFSKNFGQHGGVIVTLQKTSVTIVGCIFTHNSAEETGGVMRTAEESSFNITDSIFTNNSVKTGFGGGVACTQHQSSFLITNSMFCNNSVLLSRSGGGGVALVFGTSSFTINKCYFTNNSASLGGVIHSLIQPSFSFINSTFTNNWAKVSGGVLSTLRKSSIAIINCTFTKNQATRFGGVMNSADESLFNITNSDFNFNGAFRGGVMNAGGESSFNISNSNFTNSSSAGVGGVIWCSGGIINIDRSRFSLNAAEGYGGVLFTIGCSVQISDTTFDHNSGPLYTFSSNLTFRGNTKLENNTENKGRSENESTNHEGGAITSFQSTIVFAGPSTHLTNNQAGSGGAILSTESNIMIYGETKIANNVAVKGRGGGIFLRQSILEVKGNCYVWKNHALTGGGIHAISSTISVHQPAILEFSDNVAHNGSGIYLETNPKLYILKRQPLYENEHEDEDLLKFINNHADYGGAVYVADHTNVASCSPEIECFIQSLALHQFNDSEINTVNMFFSGNAGTEHGADIFGGLLDRCVPSPFAEVQLKLTTRYNGVSYLGNISYFDTNRELKYSLASEAVKVCFCSHTGMPDCSYQLPPIRVKKGEIFTVTVVAVDQVNRTVNADIISTLSSQEGGLGEGELIQNVSRNCTNLTYTVFSPHDHEIINIFANGPCGNAKLSTSHVIVQFINCTCPIGFEPFSDSQTATRCQCICDSKLLPYITKCDLTTSSVVRYNTRSWITYINDTDQPGFLILIDCPYDYCISPTENVSINFNSPQGEDSQCAFRRRGVLCGACQENLSLSLGSSLCLPCHHNHWPAVFVVILFAAILAGILLVTALLALNMTVAVGLINGFIFYANILDISSAVFFPSSEPSFPSVFVAWLNLDIGIDVCFIDGLDAYIKTWLQLAFPAYIISLVVIVIIISEYSPKFSRIIGKKDPIATLATLILLSYARLLSITITALSFATLHYPDGKQKIVWLPDGNVPYFQGKHIPLALVAVLIILIGLPYTILLFLWQWIVCAPYWIGLKWTRNTKLNAFMASYHASHNSKYRYWTGLLLIVRVVLYITSSLTISAKPQTTLLVTAIFVGALFLHKGVISVRVFKNSLVDIVETVLYFNLLALTVFSLYDFRVDVKKQTAIVYTSTITTLLFLIGMVIYHISLLVITWKNTRVETAQQVLNEQLLAPLQPIKTEITHSILELPRKLHRPAAGGDDAPPKVIETATLTYQ